MAKYSDHVVTSQMIYYSVFLMSDITTCFEGIVSMPAEEIYTVMLLEYQLAPQMLTKHDRTA